MGSQRVDASFCRPAMSHRCAVLLLPGNGLRLPRSASPALAPATAAGCSKRLAQPWPFWSLLRFVWGDGVAQARSFWLNPTTLMSQFDELVASGELRTGRAEAVVIEAEDPLDDMRF